MNDKFPKGIRVWTFRAHLRGGFAVELPISEKDKERLWHLVQHDDDTFMVFDSGVRRYAINRKAVIWCQFLFDLETPPEYDEESTIDEDDLVQFNFIDMPQTVTFEVSPDTADIGCEDPGLSYEATQLQDLFLSAVRGAIDPLSFIDDEGEMVFMRASDIAMFSAPLLSVELRPWKG